MKKGLKALVAFVAAGALLASMSVAAFAANYTTETKYVTGDTTKVTVTTQVSGVAENEQVAYLVTSNNDNSIVWVDQKAASGTTAEFSFTTDAADAKGLGSTIQVGTTSIAANSFDATKENLIILPTYKATWSIVGNGKVYAFGEAADDKTEVGATGVSSADIVTFVVLPDAGYELTGIKKAGVPEATIGTSNVRTFALTADTAFEFTFAATADSATAAYTGTTLTVANAIVSIPGTATGAEFGVLASKDAANLAGLDAATVSAMENGASTNGVVKYAALGANEDGSFIIALEDTDGTVFDGVNEFTGCIYAIANGNIATSTTFTFGK